MAEENPVSVESKIISLFFFFFPNIRINILEVRRSLSSTIWLPSQRLFCKTALSTRDTSSSHAAAVTSMKRGTPSMNNSCLSKMP